MKSVIGGPVRGHVQVELLSAYLDQQASPAERAYVDAHLQQCVECRAELASLRRTVTLLQALPRVSVPRAFTLSETQVGIRRPSASPGWLGGLVRGLGAIAAVALVAFVALSVFRSGQVPWNPATQSVARVSPTAQPAAKLAATEPAASPAPLLAQGQPETAVGAAQTQPEASTEQPATQAPAALAAAPQAPSAATAADSTSAAFAAESAPPTAEPQPSPTGPAPLVAKAAPSPAGAGAMGAAAAPVAGAAAMGRGGGGSSEPSGIPPEYLTPEPTPQGQPLGTALPSGVRIVYADLNALWAIDRDGGVRQLVQGQGINTPQLSPDQQWVVYRTYAETGLQVWAIRFEGGAPKLLLDDATLPEDNLPAGYTRRAISDTRWAPKGDILAVTLSLIPDPNNPVPPSVELWQINVETGDLKRSSELGRAWRPYYSPDGKSYIVLQYGTEEQPEGTLSLVDAGSGKGKLLITFPASPAKNGYDNQVVWAADGKTAYVAIPTADYGTPEPPNGTTLYRVSMNGNVDELGEIDAAQVNWSPTANAMTYTRFIDAALAKNDLYVANADGTQPQLYASMTQGEFLSWSPKGTHFLYQDNFQVFVGAVGQTARKLANFTSVVTPRWISESALLASHDTGDGWLLALRNINGDAAGLLPLPRESMWDVQSH